MPSAQRTVILPADEADYIDRLVAAGAYGSTTEVVRAGLHALQDRRAGIERWLSDEVVPVYDAMQKDPSRGLSADAVLVELKEYHAARVGTAERDS